MTDINSQLIANGEAGSGQVGYDSGSDSTISIGWTPNTLGLTPASNGTDIELRFACGQQWYTSKAEMWRWTLLGTPFDIVAYRFKNHILI